MSYQKTLFLAKQLVTSIREGDGVQLRILEHPAILVEGGLIRGIGNPGLLSKELGRDDHVVNLQDLIVLPGFVDAHTHPVYAGNRWDDFERRGLGCSYSEIAEAGGGIKYTVNRTRLADEGVLEEETRRRLSLMLASGTTTAEVKSGYGLNRETELRSLRTLKSLNGSPLRLKSTFLGAHAFPDCDKSAYLSLLEELIPTVAKEWLAESFDIFVEEGYFSSEQAIQLCRAAKAAGLGVRMHVDQFSDRGGAALAATIGATTADHLEYTSNEGIQAMVDGGVQPVLLPASVFCLGLDRYPNARGMIERGLAVVLATDLNPGSSPVASIPFVMSLACLRMKMSPLEALAACTLNAAKSLGLEGEIGSIELGKRADFTFWECGDWREIVFSAGSLRPSTVCIDGFVATGS